MSDEIALVKILTFYLPSNQNLIHDMNRNIGPNQNFGADTTTKNFQLLTYTIEALDMTYNTITQNIFVIKK